MTIYLNGEVFDFGIRYSLSFDTYGNFYATIKELM